MNCKRAGIVIAALVCAACVDGAPIGKVGIRIQAESRPTTGICATTVREVRQFGASGRLDIR